MFINVIREYFFIFQPEKKLLPKIFCTQCSQSFTHIFSLSLSYFFPLFFPLAAIQLLDELHCKTLGKNTGNCTLVLEGMH